TQKMRRTGKRAFDPTMGSEGTSQLLITYSIFMVRSSRKGAYFRIGPKKTGTRRCPSQRSLAGLALHARSVVVGLFAVIGEVETLFLRFIAGPDPDGDLQDQQDHEGYGARPDQ